MDDWHWEYQAIDQNGRLSWRTYATEEDARGFIEWSEGPRIDEMRVRANAEQEIENQREDRLYSNVDRHALRKALEALPHHVIRRKVTKWERVADVQSVTAI